LDITYALILNLLPPQKFLKHLFGSNDDSIEGGGVGSTKGIDNSNTGKATVHDTNINSIYKLLYCQVVPISHKNHCYMNTRR